MIAKVYPLAPLRSGRPPASAVNRRSAVHRRPVSERFSTTVRLCSALLLARAGRPAAGVPARGSGPPWSRRTAMITAFHPPPTFSARFVMLSVSPAGEKVHAAGEKRYPRGAWCPRYRASASRMTRMRRTVTHINHQDHERAVQVAQGLRRPARQTPPRPPRHPRCRLVPRPAGRQPETDKHRNRELSPGRR
jgi:hypothetical protein